MWSERAAHWGAVAVGTPGADFEPRPPAASPYRPDTVADGWSTGDMTVRLVSVRGYAHRYGGVPRQDDAAAVHHPGTGAVVFAVADGVSSAPLAHIGATAACRGAVTAAVADLTAGAPVDWPKVVEHAAWQVVQQAGLALGLESPDAETAEQQTASTLIAGVARPAPDGLSLALVRVGDGGAWVLRGTAYHPVWEPAAAGGAVMAPAVTALPRVPGVVARSVTLAPGEVLLVGTDGIADPLGDGTGSVGAHLAARLARPCPPLDLARDVDFSRETFDDDRTLLAVWPDQRS